MSFGFVDEDESEHLAPSGLGIPHVQFSTECAHLTWTTKKLIATTNEGMEIDVPAGVTLNTDDLRVTLAPGLNE